MSGLPNYVYQHFTSHAGPVRPHIRCKDGFSLSVQGSASHYCSPREHGVFYTTVEVWAWSQRTIPAKLKKHFRYKGEPLGWVPVDDVNALIKQHGGLAA